eukprot:816399-Rhodomonas_salina.1
MLRCAAACRPATFYCPMLRHASTFYCPMLRRPAACCPATFYCPMLRCASTFYCSMLRWQQQQRTTAATFYLPTLWLSPSHS